MTYRNRQEYSRKKYQEGRDYALSKKGYVCENCGFDEYEYLQFHHIDPSDSSNRKMTTLFAGSKEELDRELEKVRLLCDQCHHETHREMSDDICSTCGAIREFYAGRMRCRPCLRRLARESYHRRKYPR